MNVNNLNQLSFTGDAAKAALATASVLAGTAAEGTAIAGAVTTVASAAIAAAPVVLPLAGAAYLVKKLLD